ncbi:hypothetical protein AnigIFM60653_003249, partial [Aspergillus niger]
MSDDNRSLPFPCPSYPSSTSTFLDSEPNHHSWPVRKYSQPSSVDPPVPYECVPTRHAEDSAAGGSQGTPSGRTLDSKVAIPRTVSISTRTSSGRVSWACEHCRAQKAKCSGHRPTCQRCQGLGIRCLYGDRKGDKMAKQLRCLTTQVQVYEAVLRAVAPKMDLQTAQYIERFLNEKRDDYEQLHGLHAPVSSLAAELADAATFANTSPDTSLVALDYTNEDFNRDEKIQAMGFVGEHSAIAWIYRFKGLLERSKSGFHGETRDWLSVSSANFFPDSDIPIVDDVDLFQRPTLTVADQLVNCYFQVVHPSFPIVVKMIFLAQYRSFYSAPHVQPGKRWLAILNLIFAIAARHMRHLYNDANVRSEVSLVYFSRAWKLSM